MESLSNSSSGSRFAVPSLFPCSLALRATVHPWFTTFGVIMSHFQLGVQSHHRFSVSAFRAIIVFSVWCSESASSLLHLAFRATIVSQFRRSESSSCFQFDVQSHCHHFLVWRSESLSRFRRSESSSVFNLMFRVAFFSFGVQSHPHHIFSFGVQSHHYRVPRFRHLESSSLPSLTFRVAFPVSTFRAIITYSFGVQSHHYHFSILVFRAIHITFSVLNFRAITVAFSVSAFKAVITSQIDAQSRIFSFDV